MDSSVLLAVKMHAASLCGHIQLNWPMLKTTAYCQMASEIVMRVASKKNNSVSSSSSSSYNCIRIERYFVM